ncbi:BTAD domain-containing putative transcriptional regulator [Amycolatopsis rhabdoformis]|uniref:BTAD domain-containing putative transcriptional regulator n=1 Tax=Amycolatopsis rhabdoformis TaxID=1448059 RepID=A0ABZ1I531_9PSEU|nr:BTAD domain-containing putative transcriptional regulator [Amycolatopsis rhabdoformis]WSE28598.1 BTAD domain-containing putative transcriptional regulator [Amycolatopsis rhabdoformis]
MRIGVLGAVTAWDAAGEPVSVGGPRVRALLAQLALEAGKFVSAERLIDGLYGEQPPDGAANALQSQVSRLRSALKAVAPVEFTGAGYRLVIEPDEVDVHRFERLAGDGRREHAAGDATRASDLLGEALALWRGPAFADVTEAPFAATQATRLEELRADAAGDRVDAEITLGRAAEVLDELRTVVAATPLRERSRAQLVRALHAAGRSAEALAAFEDARRTLADELGADPGPELAEAHLAALRSEPAAASAPLPAQLTSFVGRDGELRQVGELLRHARLVTLLGPGGTGKTRLAVEVATVSAGPAAFVELAPHVADDVGQAVLSALGLREGASPLRGSGVQDPVERLVSALRDQATLLVLDNCEHVVDAAARLLARLLPACPGLRVLATSREPLGITGEQLAPVPRLAVPPPGTAAAEALGFPAVRLFADRAAASDPAFRVDDDTVGDVQHICAALDGLPLALELAAARVRTLPVGEIAARLENRFHLLARGSRTAETRHRSLRGVVEWSWELLDDDERRLARRLTVFSGGATLGLAEQVCDVPDAVSLLPGLADKSLVETTGDRYRMLETIRAFCAEKLAGSGESERFSAAHATAFLALAEEADPLLRTADQLRWLDRLDTEYDNLVAALRWATDADLPTALRLTAALATYWWMRGRRYEGAMLSLEVVKRCGPSAPAGYEEHFLMCLLNAMSGAPDHDATLPYQSTVERYARDMAWAPRHPTLSLLLGVVIGPPADEETLFTRSSLMSHGDPWSSALVPMGTGLRAMLTGDLDEAEARLREGEVRYRALGERWGLSMCLDHLSQLLTWRGRWDEAMAAMTESMDLMQQLGAADDYADLLCRRADSLALQGDVAGARADYSRVIALARRSGMPETRASGYVGLAALARRDGDLAASRSLAEQALAECTSGSFSAAAVRAAATIALGWVAVASGRAAEARALLREAVQTAQQWQDSTVLASALECVAGAALLDAHAAEAALLLGAAAAARGTEMVGQPDVTAVADRARALLGARYEGCYAMGRELTVQKALTEAGIAP